MHHLNLVDHLITGFFGRSCLFPGSFRGLVISSRWLWSGVSVSLLRLPLHLWPCVNYSLSDLIFFRCSRISWASDYRRMRRYRRASAVIELSFFCFRVEGQEWLFFFFCLIAGGYTRPYIYIPYVRFIFVCTVL